MSSLDRFPKDSAPEDVLRSTLRDGAAVVEGVLEASRVDAIVAETQPFLARSARGDEDFGGKRTVRSGALVARSPACREVVIHPLALELAAGLLLRSCERFQLHLTQLIQILPGETAQELHRDRLVWGRHLARELEPQLNLMWALTPFTRENGATRVAPGSPAWSWQRPAQTAEIVQAEMPAGSCLVYTGSVIHGGGENRSGEPRLGMNITYSLGWLRQEENQFLSCPPALARSLAPRLQELLGYSTGGYGLGYWSRPEPSDEVLFDLLDPEWALGRAPARPALGSAAHAQEHESDRF